MPQIIATTRRRWPIRHDTMAQALEPWEPEAHGSGFVLSPMPFSGILVRRDGLEWRFSVDTDVHGPGLHAIFYDILKAVAEELHLVYTLSDPAHFNRDFAPGRLTDFYSQELKKLAGELEARPADARMQVHWALPDMEMVEGTGVAGPISRWGRAEFLERARTEPEALVEDFYVAPHPAADGVYHRNMALLTLQNEMTYLAPGEENLAAQVCQELEEASRLHETLPLPLDEYRRCAVLAGIAPQRLPNPALAWGLIGYRREPLRQRMAEGFSWVHPGHFWAMEEEDGWQSMGDKRCRVRFRMLARAEELGWPKLDEAPAFVGLPAPELAESEMALGLKCAADFITAKHTRAQLQMGISFEPPYSWGDIWTWLNSVRFE